MEPEIIYKKINNINDKWLDTLEEFPVQEFEHQYILNKWSAAQLYSHIIEVNETILKEILNCIEGRGEVLKGKSKFLIRIIFFAGKLPPIKITVPEPLSANPPLLEKEYILKSFNEIQRQIITLLPGIKNSNPTIKTKHPRLDFLNADQWLQFLLIHLKHHYKQLEKLKEIKSKVYL